ncbi:MAG TPA: PhzF family phenazine biosynthesis isomerase [Jatrophihabitans sp.]|nr:PhzF family phenazine biosynthesis isomerase [Jatrophihabitans sp.]
MSVRVRTVDAFTDQPFRGNPAGVIRLDDRPAGAGDEWYRAVARELNLSETAFLESYEGADADYRLRWFTPGAEVDLCGHATLATAHCLFSDGLAGPIRFATRSGVLTVRAAGDGGVIMDFPAQPPRPHPVPDWLPAAIGTTPSYYGGTESGFQLAVLADAQTVRQVQPDLARIKRELSHGLIVSAVADAADLDFVSRFFAPALAVPEDPVTGSAHTVLVPYWAERLGRLELRAEQVSARGGRLGLRLSGDRVQLTGRAVTMIDGTLAIDPA